MEVYFHGQLRCDKDIKGRHADGHFMTILQTSEKTELGMKVV